MLTYIYCKEVKSPILGSNFTYHSLEQSCSEMLTEHKCGSKWSQFPVYHHGWLDSLVSHPVSRAIVELYPGWCFQRFEKCPISKKEDVIRKPLTKSIIIQDASNAPPTSIDSYSKYSKQSYGIYPFCSILDSVILDLVFLTVVSWWTKMSSYRLAMNLLAVCRLYI